MTKPMFFLWCLWFLSALSDDSEFCYIWQLKTYLLSRFKDFLSTVQGRRYFFSYRTGIRYSIALIIFALLQNTFFQLHTWSIVYPFLIGDLLYSTFLYHKKRLHKPRINAVSVLIVGSAIAIEAAILYLANDIRVFFILVIARFAIVSGLCAIIEIPRQIMITINLYRAHKKIQKYKNLLVIAITGSYGKSTTKEFLYTILSSKYHVTKTPDNLNADVGIGKFILQSDLQNTDILIIEIGAYRIGHIARVCRYIRPSISILTAINEQHVSLFGSIEKTQQAKYEILHALPGNGLGIVNGDNKYCTELLTTVQAPIKTFGKTGLNVDCELLSLDLKPDFSTAKINLTNQILTLQIPTHIAPYITNILATILVARKMGLKDEEIQDRVYNFTLPTHGLRIYNYGAATILDDSYSSNSDGFKLALDRLNTYPSSRKKVLVTRGMIELGSLHNEIHKNIGYKIATIVDEVIIITPDAVDSITQGIKEKNSNVKIQHIYDAKKIVAIFKHLKDTSAVILIENRIPELLKAELKKHHVTT